MNTALLTEKVKRVCVTSVKLTTPVKGLTLSCEEAHKDKFLWLGTWIRKIPDGWNLLGGEQWFVQLNQSK